MLILLNFSKKRLSSHPFRGIRENIHPWKWRGDKAYNDVIPSRERIRPSIFTRGQYNPGRWKIPSLTASVPGATHAGLSNQGQFVWFHVTTLRNFAYVGKNWPGPGGRHELWSSGASWLFPARSSRSIQHSHLAWSRIQFTKYSRKIALLGLANTLSVT